MTQTSGPTAHRVRVDHESGDRFRVTARQHILHVDQPEADGGEDSAPTPTELFIAGLASCVAFYVRRHLTRHGLPLDGLSVTAEYEFAARPSRVGEVGIKVRLAAELTPEQRAAVVAVASRCSVHNSLERPPVVRIELGSPALSPA